MIELKFDGATGELQGYASTWGGPPDSYGDIVMPGAFAKSLAAHKAAGSKPLMLWSHDPTQIPIGTWHELREDAKGLFVKGTLNTEIERAREVRSALLAGSMSGLSIGFRTPPGGRVAAKGFWELREVDLREISIVSMPANTRATISSVKSTTSRDLLDAALADIQGIYL